MTSNFVFRGQKTNGKLDATLDFLTCCQKANDYFGTTCSRRMNGTLGTILKIFFGCEKRMAVWVLFSKFCISL